MSEGLFFPQQTTSGITFTVLDTQFILTDNADTSKRAMFECSSITTATTRTFTFPDTSTTFVGTGSSQTITNKIINAIQLVDASIPTAKYANSSVTSIKLDATNEIFSSVTTTQTITSTSFAPITNASATITTVGKSVILTLQSVNDPSTSSYILISGSDQTQPCEIQFKRDSTVVTTIKFGRVTVDNTTYYYSPSGFSFKDLTPSVGSHTYTALARITAATGTTSLSIASVVLVATEEK